MRCKIRMWYIFHTYICHWVLLWNWYNGFLYPISSLLLKRKRFFSHIHDSQPDSWNSTSIHLSLETEHTHISRFCLTFFFFCMLPSYAVDSSFIFSSIELASKKIPWTQSTFHDCISITMYNKHRCYIDISSLWYSSSNSMMFFILKNSHRCYSWTRTY